MPVVLYPHVEFREGRVPWITGTSTKVIEIVLDYLAYHWDSEEIRRQHPHLTPGQIHSAMGYYYDNQAEMDAQIEERLRREGELITSLGESPIRAKVLAAKLTRRLD